MTHKTKGIVLRTIKYSETSLVVTIFTELFGVQTYMVNGVRSTKKSLAKANYFQPAAILNLIVYHTDTKAMHRIKEFSWAILYNTILFDVIKNNIALYMVELLQKCLKQPETNTNLYNFCEDVLLHLDKCNKKITANIALFFALHLTHFLGFKMADNYDDQNCILDLQEGNFVNHQPIHAHFIDAEGAKHTSQVLKAMHPYELEDVILNQSTRRKLLLSYLNYYALHISDFGQMKTLQVLHEVL